MSNFNGWTSEIINKIKLQKIINDSNKKEKNKTVKVKKTHKDYVTPIQKALLSLGIESEKEYKFDKSRIFCKCQEQKIIFEKYKIREKNEI